MATVSSHAVLQLLGPQTFSDRLLVLTARPLEVDEVPEAQQEAHDDLVAEYEPCELTTVAMPEGSGARAIAAGEFASNPRLLAIDVYALTDGL